MTKFGVACLLLWATACSSAPSLDSTPNAICSAPEGSYVVELSVLNDGCAKAYPDLQAFVKEFNIYPPECPQYLGRAPNTCSLELLAQCPADNLEKGAYLKIEAETDWESDGSSAIGTLSYSVAAISRSLICQAVYTVYIHH